MSIRIFVHVWVNQHQRGYFPGNIFVSKFTFKTRLVLKVSINPALKALSWQIENFSVTLPTTNQSLWHSQNSKISTRTPEKGNNQKMLNCQKCPKNVSCAKTTDGPILQFCEMTRFQSCRSNTSGVCLSYFEWAGWRDETGVSGGDGG